MTSETGGRWKPIVAIATAISLAVAVALLFWHPRIALGFVGGVITGAGMLSALVLVLNRVVVPPQERESHPAPWVVLHIVKFALAAALAYVVIEILQGDVLAFAGGYTVSLVVLLIIMAGEPTVSARLLGEDEEASEDIDPDTSAG
jgi:hypothetical protein